MAGEVPAGTSSAYHELTSKPGKPDSAMVGSSGATLDRLVPVVASALSLPALTCGSDDATLPNSTCASPASTAAAAGPPPL